MRVLHVMPDLSRAFGGPTQSLLGYLAASRAAGIEAAVVAPAPPAADLAWFREQSGDTAIHTLATPPGSIPRVPRELLRHIRRQREAGDIVHVHGLFNPLSTFAARSCRRAAIPYVIRPFGTLSRFTFEHRRRLLKRAYFSLLDAPNIRGAGALHFTTAEERDEAARLLPVRLVPAAVVPPPWVGAATVSDGARQERGRGSAETVLFLSRIHPKKGLESLIDAWPRIRRARPDARLVIAGAGDPDYERTLRARVLQGGEAESVHFAGFVAGPEKARWLEEADVFVLPSLHENFGVVVLEAIAAGLPAVISPDVQLADVVRRNQVGAVVSREPAMLADGIVSVLGDSALRERCATQGATIVQSLFSPGVIGLQLRAMYELARSRSTTQG